MPNHIHVIFYLPEKAGIVNQIVANGKRFMAYEIVSRLKAKNRNKILRRLKDGVSKSEFRSGKIHKVFNTSFDAKICEAREFVEQKLNYVHHNPVSGKWSIVDDWSKYPHSSAAYYEYGIQCKTPVTHYLDYF